MYQRRIVLKEWSLGRKRKGIRNLKSWQIVLDEEKVPLGCVHHTKGRYLSNALNSFTLISSTRDYTLPANDRRRTRA